MANTIRIKRSTGSTAPSSLANAELAYTEGGGGTLYIGVGTGGAGGSATSVVAIGGPAAFLSSSTAASTYLTQSNAASTYATQSSLSSYVTTSTAASTYAPLASPALSGTPTAPTAAANVNSTQIATTAYVSTAISNLVNGAGSALDTLKELADALGNDASFSTTITTSIGGKLAKASNLSDLTDASAARTNLGLGSMATQSASSVNITGGSIDGVTLDCGTF